jgi:hypothetical protein
MDRHLLQQVPASATVKGGHKASTVPVDIAASKPPCLDRHANLSMVAATTKLRRRCARQQGCAS